MNSEKVKEIKESLKQEIHSAEYVDSSYANIVSLDLLKDILTLINDLEGENKIFLKSKTMWKCLHTELYKENKQLKLHITEVEKGVINIARERNKKEELASKFIDCYNDSLKQFAERLKEKSDFYRHGERITDMVTFDDIDETLKEFIDGRN